MTETPMQPNPAALLHVMTPPQTADSCKLTEAPHTQSYAFRYGKASGALMVAHTRTEGLLKMIERLRRVQYMSHDEVLNLIEESVTEMRDTLSRDMQV